MLANPDLDAAALDLYRRIVRAWKSTGVTDRGARHQAATLARARELRDALTPLARAIDAYNRRRLTPEALRAAMTEAERVLAQSTPGATE